MTIMDSGTRREFTSGAVRDMQDGKGRCDLLPLGIIAERLESSVLIPGEPCMMCARIIKQCGIDAVVTIPKGE